MRDYSSRGTSGIDIDLQKVDIDQCPLPEGSPENNVFAGSHKCKQRTTRVSTHFVFSSGTRSLEQQEVSALVQSLFSTNSRIILHGEFVAEQVAGTPCCFRFLVRIVTDRSQTFS